MAQYKASAGAAGGPPPPPPPPPPPAAASPTVTVSDGGAAAVFAALNKGEAVTQGLRKVDKSEMTHKNPSLRAGSVVPERATSPSPAGKKPIRPSKPQALMGKKPSKLALEGKVWAVVSNNTSGFTGAAIYLMCFQEYQENEPSLVIEDAQLNQSVNLFGCKQSTIIIKGKVNAVTLGM